MRQSAERWVRGCLSTQHLAFLVVLVPFLMAANCSPSPVSRSGGCPAGGVSCSLSELPACINFCAPRPSPSVAEGVRCVLDPCDTAGFAQPSTYLCPDNFSCIADLTDPGFGTCHATDASVFMGCHPVEGPPCPTGTYCRPFDVNLARPAWITSDYDGVCMLPVREGGLCDSDFGHPGILVCEPGTNCDTDPLGLSSTLRCRRPCESDDDCPCEVDSNPTAVSAIECHGEGSSTGFCTTCSPNGGDCDYGPDARCCDEPNGATCNQVNILGVAQAVCCRPSGEACDLGSSIFECCPNSNCNEEGLCEACVPVGEEVGSGECCGLSAPAGPDGICSRPCTWRGYTMSDGDPCDLADSPGCTGTMACRPAGGDCVPPSNVAPNDTTCDDVDEDCDGDRDEDYAGGSCSERIATCANPGGFTPGMGGEERCDHGTAICEYGPGDYCQYDAGANLVHGRGDQCLVGSGLVPTPCNTGPGTLCGPGEICGPAGSTCSAGVDGCCEIYSGGIWTYVNCCRTNLMAASECWNP